MRRRSILRLSRTPEQAELEIREMQERSGQAASMGRRCAGADAGDSLLQRKYVVPFIIACIVLACTQATGINSILSYAAKILQGAGLTEKGAAFNLQIITGINCVVTLIGALLVDRLGRKILLTVGTGGIILCLTSAGLLFNSFESRRVDVLEQVRKADFRRRPRSDREGRSEFGTRRRQRPQPAWGDFQIREGVQAENRFRVLQRCRGRRPRAQD